MIGIVRNRSYCRAAMGEVPSPGKVVDRNDDYIVVQGGFCEERVIALRVRKVGVHKFWVIRMNDRDASMFLVGTPACYRPLCKLHVWKELREQIEATRDAKEQANAQAAEEEEAEFDLVEGSADTDGDDKKESAKKRKKVRDVRTAQEKPFIEIKMPCFHGQTEPRRRIMMINSTKFVGISATPDVLQWLIDYIHSERHE